MWDYHSEGDQIGVQLVGLLSHVCEIVFYLYALVVDWAINVLAEDLHSGAALAVYALDP